VVKSLISGNMEENKILGEHSDLFQIIKDTMIIMHEKGDYNGYYSGDNQRT
jgi:hypothetical protein